MISKKRNFSPASSILVKKEISSSSRILISTENSPRKGVVAYEKTPRKSVVAYENSPRRSAIMEGEISFNATKLLAKRHKIKLENEKK